MQTGNKELGQETKGFEEEAEAAKAELGNKKTRKKKRKCHYFNNV